MVDIGYVSGSFQQAKEIIIGLDTVYIHKDIKKEVDSEGNETGMYTYHEIQYTKDEYLEILKEKNRELESNITDLQLALVELYETSMINT